MWNKAYDFCSLLMWFSSCTDMYREVMSHSARCIFSTLHIVRMPKSFEISLLRLSEAFPPLCAIASRCSGFWKIWALNSFVACSWQKLGCMEQLYEIVNSLKQGHVFIPVYDQIEDISSFYEPPFAWRLLII